MDDLSKAYEAFTQTTLGQHFVDWLISQRDELRYKAEKATDPQEAYGLLKNAHAFTMVLTHLETMKSGNKIVSRRQLDT